MAFRFTSQFAFSPTREALAHARSTVQQGIDAGELPFALLPYQDEETLGAIENLAQQLRDKFTTFIIVGIGGSDLGARAAHRALNHQFYNLQGSHKLFFAGDTTDPRALEEIMDMVHWQQTCVVVISKSGNTIEVMASYLVLRTALKAHVGDAYKEHIVAVTDPKTGTFRKVVEAEGYVSLPHPAVGGRFSVLSAVGLLPLALSGVDIRALLGGAKRMLELEREKALDYASLQHAAYNAGQHIQVLMPYTYALREFGFWFRQIWAESLGKALSTDGQEVHLGPTPIAAVGPTDQHSQVQLYREGPADKTFTFITVAETCKLQVPLDIPNVPELDYLKGLSFNTILQAEKQGTEESLHEVGRPTFTIELDRLDAEHLGGLFMFFELATAYSGAFFNINAYDQPGVERGKEIAHARLRQLE